MTLLTLQRTMRDTLLSDDIDGTLSPGAQVYRNAYRSRLLDVLRSAFELTRRWAGEDAFDSAARHHIIQNPPKSWTLDYYGAGFDATLAELFASDPEVSELAWLEWHMHRAFAALDEPVISPADLNAALGAAGDWEQLTIAFQSGLAARPIRTACAQLWLALRNGTMEPADLMLAEPACLIVWRQSLVPHFRVADQAEYDTMNALREGQTFGAACESLALKIGPESAVVQVGSMLGRWLRDGTVSDLSNAS